LQSSTKVDSPDHSLRNGLHDDNVQDKIMNVHLGRGTKYILFETFCAEIKTKRNS